MHEKTGFILTVVWLCDSRLTGRPSRSVGQCGLLLRLEFECEQKSRNTLQSTEAMIRKSVINLQS